MNKKYQKATEKLNVKNFSKLDSKPIDDIIAEIKSIDLPTYVKKTVRPSGECLTSVPKAIVELNTKNDTTFYAEFFLDYYDEDFLESNYSRCFSTLLSNCEVQWYGLNNIISNTVKLSVNKNKSKLRLKDPKEPMNIKLLQDTKKKDIICEDIEDDLVESILGLAKNKSTSLASINKIEERYNLIDITFELDNGSTFLQRFSLKEPSKKTIYKSFWSFCLKYLGYIPIDNDEYSDLTGRLVDVEYDKGQWFVNC